MKSTRTNSNEGFLTNQFDIKAGADSNLQMDPQMIQIIKKKHEEDLQK